MLVHDVMKGEVLSISPFASLVEASQIFSQRKVKYLVVMHGNDVQGILSLADMDEISEDAKDNIKIADMMTVTPVCIAASSELKEAERLIRESGIQALPVCQVGILVGIVTLEDIQEFFSRLDAIDTRSGRKYS